MRGEELMKGEGLTRGKGFMRWEGLLEGSDFDSWEGRELRRLMTG